jgi:uncharacterized protein (TIGR00304 family)
VENKQLTEINALHLLGIGLVFAGIVILVLAVVLASVRRVKKGKVKAAGAIIIGPVPIVFGTDKKSLKTVLVLSVVLTALLIVAMIVYYLLFR